MQPFLKALDPETNYKLVPNTSRDPQLARLPLAATNIRTFSNQEEVPLQWVSQVAQLVLDTVLIQCAPRASVHLYKHSFAFVVPT